MFGPDDLVIYSSEHSQDKNYTKLGKYYELPPGIEEGSDQAKSYLAGSYKFKMKELEVF